jgi:hypothetical protein
MQPTIEAILRDESLAFEERLRRARSQADPRNAIEDSLLEEIVHLGSQLDRVKKAYLEQIRAHIESAQENERDLVHELGSRLFHDRLGHRCLFGTRNALFTEVTTSWPAKAIDPDDPAVLVRKLELTGAGCRWLRDQWTLLRERLAPQKNWQSPDRFKAIRLLGHQPIDAAEDRTIAELYLASFGLDGHPANAWVDLLSDMGKPTLKIFSDRVMVRFPDMVGPHETEKCRQILTDLVDRNIEDLNAKVAKHTAAAQLTAERTVDLRRFDQSADADRMRRFELKCRSQYFQAIQLYRKLRGRKIEADGRAAKGLDASELTRDDSVDHNVADGPSLHQPPARRRSTRRPMEDPESLKALAEPIGDLIKDMLEESPVAFEYLRPYLPSSLAPPIAVDLSNDPAHEELKALVKPLGNLIRDLLTEAPSAVTYLQPYLPTPLPPTAPVDPPS